MEGGRLKIDLMNIFLKAKFEQIGDNYGLVSMRNRAHVFCSCLYMHVSRLSFLTLYSYKDPVSYSP